MRINKRIVEFWGSRSGLATFPFIFWNITLRHSDVSSQRRDDEMIPTEGDGVAGGVTALDSSWYERQTLLLLHTKWKHQAFRVACCESVHCDNAFRPGRKNSSFTTKSCACASIAFRAGITSWSVDSSVLIFKVETSKKTEHLRDSSSDLPASLRVLEHSSFLANDASAQQFYRIWSLHPPGTWNSDHLETSTLNFMWKQILNSQRI